MNTLLLQGALSVASKIVPILQAVFTEIGPALATLGPDIAQLVTDANKVLTDLDAIFMKLKTGVGAAAAGTTPPAA
jgi:hypothetical protein